MAIFKTQRLHDLAQIHDEKKLVDCLDQDNSLQLQLQHFKQLKTLLDLDNRVNSALRETLIESALLESFHPDAFLASN